MFFNKPISIFGMLLLLAPVCNADIVTIYKDTVLDMKISSYVKAAPECQNNAYGISNLDSIENGSSTAGPFTCAVTFLAEALRCA